MKYVLISDTHNHNWAAMSKQVGGMNSRLEIILKETLRAAQEGYKFKADALFHAGDLFHVRGAIAPSVLNPTLDVYKQIAEDVMGLGEPETKLPVYLLPGNHDMEGRDMVKYTDATSAMRQHARILSETQRWNVVRHGGEDRVVTVPWISSVETLKMRLLEAKKAFPTRRNMDLILHAPINGTIKGLPDHGLEPEWLADLGFKRVFAGHYHNHKHFGNGVYSIGALTHQTWGDVGSKAGFLLVDDDNVVYRASQAPRFVDLDTDWDEERLIDAIDGNYVRVRAEFEKNEDVRELRDGLIEMGALDVVIHPIMKKAAMTREEGTIASGASVAVSVGDYIKTRKYKPRFEMAVKELSMNILSEAEESL